MNVKQLIFMKLMIYSQYALAQMSKNIFPVAGEIFQIDLAQLFGKITPYQVSIESNSTPVPFKVTNYGTVVNNNVVINGTIISSIAALQFGNPNIPDNRYSYLVEVYNENNSSQFQGYQLYEGRLQQNGSINPIAISAIFNPSNSSCYTVEYIQIPQYENSLAAAFCLFDISSELSSIGLYYKIPNSSQLIFMNETFANNFNRSSVKQVKTQVTSSLYGQVYLTVLYIMNDSDNIISIFQFNSGIEKKVYLQYIDQTFFEDYNIVSFFLATDLSLFILQNDQLIVVNATNYYSGQISNVNFYSADQINMCVYQTSTTTINQLMYIAVVSSNQIIYLEYQKQQFSRKESQLSQYLIETPFISAITSVFTSKNSSFSNSRVEQSLYFERWNEILIGYNQSTVAAFDNYNNVLVWALNNGTILTIQFRDTYLTTPEPLNLTTPNSSFILQGITNQGLNTSVQINYTVVANSTLAQYHQKQYLNPQIWIQGMNYRPKEYFIGPNLEYSTSVKFSAQTEIVQISTMWTKQFQNTKINNCVFIQSFKLDDEEIILIYQINQNGSFTTYVTFCLIQINICDNQREINKIKDLIQQMSMTKYQLYTTYYLAFWYASNQTTVTIIKVPYNYIKQPRLWEIQSTININTFFSGIGLNATLKSIAALYNRIYIVTQNPSELIVVQLQQKSNFLLNASTKLQNYAPQNIWVNQDKFGELLFLDNVYELVILQLVSQNLLAQINTIPYPVQNYTSFIFGMVNQGIFLTFLRDTETSIYFYPFTNIQTISLNPSNYTTTPGTFNYTINSIIATTSQYYQYFVDEKTLLVYQYSESSLGSLYTTYNFSSNIQKISVVSQILVNNSIQIITELITIVVNGEVMFLTLSYNPEYEIQLSMNNQYLVQSGQFFIDIYSNGHKQGEQSYFVHVIDTKQNYTLTPSYLSTLISYYFNITGSYDSQNTKNLSISSIVYPYPDFFGPISTLRSKFKTDLQNSSINVSQQMVQEYNINSASNLQSFYYSFTEVVLAQNAKEVYTLNTSNPQNVTKQELYKFYFIAVNCPYLGQYNETLYLSVCSLVERNIVNLWYWNSTQNITLNLSNVNGILQSAFYQNGVLTLITISNAYVCALNIQTTQQIQCQQALKFDQNVTNFPSINILQFYSSNINLNQSYALIVPYDSYFQFLTIGVNDQTNLSISSNFTINFTFINQNQTLSNLIQNVFSNYGYFYRNKSNWLYQIVQTQNTQIINNNAEVPVFLATNSGNYGLNLYFNINNISNPILDNIILQCGYNQHPGAYLGTVAINDLILTAYHHQFKVIYQSYRSSNKIFGGHGSPVCIPNDGNIKMIQSLGSCGIPVGIFDQLSFIAAQILPNGQLFFNIQDTSYLIQLLPGYNFTFYYLSSYNYSITQTEVEVFASNQQNSAQNIYQLYIIEEDEIQNPKPTPNTSQQKFNYLWYIIGGTLTILLIIGLIVGAYIKFKQSKQNYDNYDQLILQQSVEL